MLPTPSKFILPLTAAMLLTASPAFAERKVKRIDHPNGAPTFVAQPGQRKTTVGLYANDRGSAKAIQAQRTENRIVRLQLGRGQYIPLRMGNR